MDTVKYVRAGWLIDGSGQKALSDQLISIRNGKIQSIAKWNEIHFPEASVSG